MDIQIHCPSCTRTLTFARTAAGHQDRCPACGCPLYVPMPADELEVLPLAPDDDRVRESALQAERRAVDRLLAREDTPAAESFPATPATTPAGKADEASVEQLIVIYLAAMRDSNLQRAEACAARLREQRADALAWIDRLAADQIPPAAVQNLPPSIYQGFLRNLRSQL